jgi:hypothetical protein
VSGRARGVASALAGALVFAVAGPVRGQSVSAEAGVRLGVGFPFGTVDSLQGDTLGATVAALAPVGLDFGLRIGRHLYVGPYLAVGYGATGSGLGGGGYYAGLYILDTRFGLNAHYHLRPREGLDPWFGLGAGYEWLQIEGFGGGNTPPPGVSGWEILSLQSGLDFGRQHGLGIGPFVSFSLSEYTPGAPVYTQYTVMPLQPHGTLHEWLVIGVRVAFDLAPPAPIH